MAKVTGITIAVWDGQNKELNGQKAVTQWNELKYKMLCACPF
jgi:hypothetical protein|tara:strand:+ start:160 stop:285 length:126 start_codon:yes stop_codon:yes gene_type:complete